MDCRYPHACPGPFLFAEAMNFTHRWEFVGARPPGWMSSPLAGAEGAGAAAQLQGTLVNNEQGVLVCLSNVWGFEEDGVVILRAILKFSGMDLAVLRMNSISIKFTLNVAFKKFKSFCKEFRPHGVTYEMVL